MASIEAGYARKSVPTKRPFGLHARNDVKSVPVHVPTWIIGLYILSWICARFISLVLRFHSVVFPLFLLESSMVNAIIEHKCSARCVVRDALPPWSPRNQRQRRRVGAVLAAVHSIFKERIPITECHICQREFSPRSDNERNECVDERARLCVRVLVCV